MTSELSTRNEGDGGSEQRRIKMDGTEPMTDYNSQTVMMTAERHDKIEVTEVVDYLADGAVIPSELSVIKRTELYHGPELLVHAKRNGRDHNYLITAPGPHSHLYLWAGDGPVDGKRRKWFAAAEIKAALAAEQPPYETCSQCGDPIRTIEHEREATTGNCSRAKSIN